MTINDNYFAKFLFRPDQKKGILNASATGAHTAYQPKTLNQRNHENSRIVSS